MREKATIDHLAQNFDKPKPHGEKNTLRSPTTATGLSVEDRVRKEWYPSQRWPPHVLNKSRCLQPLRGNDGTSATSEASAGSRCGHGRSRHRRDHVALRRSASSFVESIARPPRRLKIALMLKDHRSAKLYPKCLETVRSAAELCASLGHVVEEADANLDMVALRAAEFQIAAASTARSCAGAC